MKKITALVIAAIMLVFSLAACDKDRVDPFYPTRAAAFYGKINKSDDFWFEMQFTNDGVTYKFTQAKTKNAVTTISDYEGEGSDSYEVAIIGTDGAFVHKLNLKEKKYDSLVTSNYQDFLFKDYTPSMFSTPIFEGDAEFEGQTYYCETYETTSQQGGAIDGANKYYFTKGRLNAIEILEGGKVIMIMRFTDYGDKIPSDIHVKIPDGFKGNTVQFESIIDFSEMYEWQ